MYMKTGDGIFQVLRGGGGEGVSSFLYICTEKM